MKHSFLDLYREGDSLVHRLDPRLKFLATLAFIVVVSLWPGAWWPGYLALLSLVLAAVMVAGVPLHVALGRSLVALPFALMAALSLPFMRPGTPLWALALGPWRLTATWQGLAALLGVLAKSWLSVQAAGLLTATTPFPDLLAGLQALGLPRVLAALMSFLYRYLFVLVDEALRLWRARESRSARVDARSGGTVLWRAQVLGRLIGSLFIRSYERSERIYQAMLARGFRGEVKRAVSCREPAAGAPAPVAALPVSPIVAGEVGVGAPAILEVEGLSYTYPDGHEALHDICLALAEGEKVALTGPNGAGKSTLLLHLNGILRGRGRLRVAGLALEERNLGAIRSQVGLVFQDPDDQLFSPTVCEDVGFGPLYMGLGETEVRERVRQALAAVGAAGFEARQPHHLSLGERKRVAIATVLAMRPRLLVLDEPSAGLDPRGRRQLIELLRSLPQTMLVASHDLLLVRDLCPRTVILNGGRIVADGPTAKLLADQALLRAHGLELP